MGQGHLLGGVVGIALTHLHDVGGLLLGLFNFFPCLLLFLLQEGDSVGQELDVLLGALTRHTLLSEGRANRTGVVLTLLSFVLLLVVLVLVSIMLELLLILGGLLFNLQTC